MRQPVLAYMGSYYTLPMLPLAYIQASKEARITIPSVTLSRTMSSRITPPYRL